MCNLDMSQQTLYLEEERLDSCKNWEVQRDGTKRIVRLVLERGNEVLEQDCCRVSKIKLGDTEAGDRSEKCGVVMEPNWWKGFGLPKIREQSTDSRSMKELRGKDRAW